MSKLDPNSIADSTLQLAKKIEGLRILQYDATPPKLPVNFNVAEI